MDRKFKCCKEDFICEHCQKKVVGNGYTNHCPFCLYSKHVDINPGDRKCSCQGLMKPVAVEITRNGYTIVHQCEKCGVIKRNKTASDDSFEAILMVSKSQGGGSDGSPKRPKRTPSGTH